MDQTKTLNLAQKRTLPRPVIKWLQGLDLSYSIKDYRKDLSNGFLIAEVISRYEPGRIQMTAFDNSQNSKKRQNNWQQLKLFFQKHTLRDTEIGFDEYSTIYNNSDHKSQQLFHFICKIYTCCTKKTLAQPPAVPAMSQTQANPNLTASFLLKDDGLQKLQKSQFSNLEQSPNQSKVSDRVPTRKIAPNVDTIRPDVNVNLKGRKMTSKKKSWNYMEEDSNIESQQNMAGQKLTFDYLNDILQQCLPQDASLRELFFPQNAKFSPTETLIKCLPIDQGYLLTFLKQLQESRGFLIPVIMRELNQIWKFFRYLFKIGSAYQFQSVEFDTIYETIVLYANQMHQKQFKRVEKIFMDLLIINLIQEIKNSPRKRNKLMALLSVFIKSSREVKRLALLKLKELLGSDSQIFVSWLGVLLQIQCRSQLDEKFAEDFIYYAHQNLKSSKIVLRTASLKIFYSISSTPLISNIYEFFLANLPTLSSSRTAEHSLYLILIYYNILQKITSSKQYLSLVKGNNNSLTKSYNPDNQKLAEQLKTKLANVCEGIFKLTKGTPNPSVKQVSAKKSVRYFQSSTMRIIFLDYIANIQDRQELFKQQQVEYGFKNFQYTCQMVDMKLFQEFSNEIILQIISLKGQYQLVNFLEVLAFTFTHLNIKKISLEIWQNISTNIIRYYPQMLREEYFLEVLKGLNNIYDLYFNYDLKVSLLNVWVLEQLSTMPKEKAHTVAQSISSHFKSQFQKSKNEHIKTTMEEFQELIEGMEDRDKATQFGEMFMFQIDRN